MARISFHLLHFTMSYQPRWRSLFDSSEQEFTGHYESFVTGIGFWLQDYARLNEHNYFFETLPWMEESQDDTSITTIVGVFDEHHSMVIYGHHIDGKIEIYEEYEDNKRFLGVWIPDLNSTEDLMSNAFCQFILSLIDYFVGDSNGIPHANAYWRPVFDQEVNHTVSIYN